MNKEEIEEMKEYLRLKNIIVNDKNEEMLKEIYMKISKRVEREEER